MRGNRVPWRGSLRIHGAAWAAAVCCALTWAAGAHLAGRAMEADAREQAAAVRPHMPGLAERLAGELAARRMDAVRHRLAQAVAEPPGARAHVVDGSGEVLAAAGAARPLHSWESWGEGVGTGRRAGRRFLELREGLDSGGKRIGTLRLQLPMAPPAWAAAVPGIAAAAGGAAWLLMAAYLAFALRGTRRVLRTLARAEAGDYYQRAALVGCSEIRAVADRLHQTLEAFVRDGKRAQEVYLETALALCKTIEAKDRYTSGHSQRVAVYAEEMGRVLGFDEDRLNTLVVGAKLHDIGKVAVADAVLLKPGPLDDDEFEAMKKHPLAGDRILSALPGMRDMADIARSHHEKWDGSGYPYGVAGDAIPLEGRIVAIADCYDALVTKRSYKPAVPDEKALAILEKDAGSHFDPELVRLFVSMKRNGQGYRALAAGDGEGAEPAPASRPAKAARPGAR